PPTVSLASPAANQVYPAPANVTLTATASPGSGATLSKVEFYQGTTLIGTDTSAPYSMTWSNVPAAAGSYLLTAKATDNRGLSTPSATIPIVVNAAPTIAITSPANNQVMNAPANVTLTATAGDADGGIGKVDFYQGTTPIGTATTAPYSLAWSNVPAGTYTLTAQATDNRGIVTTSAPVSLVVNPAGEAPGMYFIHPDHLGTPRLITDNAGQVVWRWDNDEPFGDNLANADPQSTGTAFQFNLRFPGQYFDQETGTHYNYFRDYDPVTGRYVQSDAIGLAGGINTFEYVNSVPTLRVDPEGLQVQLLFDPRTWALVGSGILMATNSSRPTGLSG
ncbi:MAG: Ig-like domain-containing protein, partial [Desulfobacterales bacterium]|nr:Ig-like domain-containing protein [Desulfobacterales bacterium]